MKNLKKFLIFTLSFIISVGLFAHAPLISIDDNNDGTIYIEGGFSNGSPVEGVECLIVKDKPYNGPEETFNGKEIIYKGKFDKNNSLTVPKPATKKYEVYMNAGDEHVIGKKGPVLKNEEVGSWNEKIANFDFGDWKETMTTK